MPSIVADTEGQLFRLAIEYCRSRGAFVRKPNDRAKWMTPKQLAERAGLKATALHKRLRASNCPPFEREQGKRRITRVLCHEKLLAFLQQPKQPGKTLCQT